MPLLVLVCALTQLLAVGREAGVPASRQTGIVSGRVETEQAGVRTPLRRAKVMFTREGSRDSSATITDGEGTYSSESLAPGRYVVSAEKPGFVRGASASIEVVSGGARSIDLVLTPGGALEGRLQDDRDGPIARLPIVADQLGEQGAVAASFVATTDDLGRFRVHSLPAGRYRLRATPPPPASGDQYFYPGTITAGSARVITVTAGATNDRLQFIVPAAPLSPVAAAAIEGAAQVGSNDVPDPKAARVAGTITRSDSGQPIAYATAQLTDATGVARHRARTGIDGRFDITGVPAGVWVLSAVATGFVSVDAAVNRPTGLGVRVTVKDGDRLRQDVQLAPMSAIEGFVVDEFGDPAPGVVVQVAQRGVVVGLSRFISNPTIATTGMTDDRGWFRAPGLFPGDYYLIAVPQPFDKSWMTLFAPTFFPGTTTADAATPISIVAGRDVHNARFALTRARSGNVTGTVIDGAGKLVPKSRVMLIPTEAGEVRAMVMATGTAETDGTFRFSDVPEGTYVVQAIAAGMFGRAEITVAGIARDSRPAIVTMKPLTTARGRVLFEGDPAAPPAQRGQLITFQPTDFTRGPVGGNRIVVTIHPDWSFEIPNLAWHGLLRVTPPAGFALARVRHEGRDITDTPFDFQSGDVSGLEVVLTNRVGTVSGTVTSAGRTAANVRVLVLGADDTSWPYLSRMTSGRTDDRGSFTVSGLLPGRYLAVATSADVQASDHASLLALRSVGVPFTVSERANTVVTLTLSR